MFRVIFIVYDIGLSSENVSCSNDFKYAVQKEQKLLFTFKHLQIKLLIETGTFYIVNHVKKWCWRDLRD